MIVALTDATIREVLIGSVASGLWSLALEDDRRTLTYCGRKMVSTLGSTFLRRPLWASTPNCLAYEAGAEALPLWEDTAETCDEASRPACRSLAGASAGSCP